MPHALFYASCCFFLFIRFRPSFKQIFQCLPFLPRFPKKHGNYTVPVPDQHPKKRDIASIAISHLSIAKGEHLFVYTSGSIKP